MSNVIQHQGSPQGLSHNPFAANRHGLQVNQGSTQIEEARAVAQQQAAYIVAQMRPRDEHAAYVAIMTACKRKGLAEDAIYAFPRGSQTVSGPSIRLAEEIARCWGNIDFGIIELSQGVGFSEMQAFAIDLQTNTRRSTTFVVKHERHLKDGTAVPLTDPRDVYEMNANNGARRLRAMLLSIIPADVVDDAVEQCKATLKGDASVPLEDRIKKMLVAFKELNVSQERFEARLTRPASQMTPDDVAEYTAIYKSIKSGSVKATDFFPLAGESAASEGTGKGAADKLAKAKDAPEPPKAEKPATKPKAEPKAETKSKVETVKIEPVEDDAADDNPLEGAGEDDDQWGE